MQTSPTPFPGTANESSKEISFLPSPKQFLLLLGLYFLLQVVGRGLISETLGLDDAEQALLAQNWSWGYGPQPPLYTWLVLCLAKTIGISSWSLALLKNLMLFGLYLFAYLNMRLLTRSHAAGIAMAAALEMMPSISYEAQRELTHSILASMLVMACIFIFLRLKPKHIKGYIILGLTAGLGTISKYNFNIVLAAMLLAGLTLKTWRPLVLNWRMALTLGMATLIALPNMLWMIHNQELAMASAYKLQIDPSHQTASIFTGILKACKQGVNHLGLLSAITLVIFWRWKDRKQWVWNENERFLGWILLWITTLVFLGIGIFAVRDLHSRWFQPLFMAAPLLLVSLAVRHFTPQRLKWFVGIGAVAAFGITLAQPVRILLTETLHKDEILNAPFRQLATELKTPLSNAKSILAEDCWLAGNLRVWYPAIPVSIPKRSPLFKPNPDATLIWDISPGKKSSFAARFTKDHTNSFFIEQRLKYHKTNTMKVAIAPPISAMATP